MPQAYIKKLAEEGKGTIAQLERKWDEAKAKANHETYKEILQMCYKQIQTKSTLCKNSVFFIMPPIVVGKPTYNMEHAGNYIMAKLEKGGFKVSRQSNVCLFIQW